MGFRINNGDLLIKTGAPHIFVDACWSSYWLPLPPRKSNGINGCSSKA